VNWWIAATRTTNQSPLAGLCTLAKFLVKRESTLASSWRFLIFAMVSLLMAFWACAQSPPSEYELKAAFVYHFAQMVEWPPQALASKAAPLLICTIGDDENATALARVVQGKQIGDHPIQARHLHAPAEIPGCHLLVITASEKKRASSLLAGVEDAPVLTVGDGDDFVAQGGMIGLTFQDKKVRFDINLTAAQRVNLKISSRLLLLARNVIGAARPG
jgi:hypothetical protein